MGKLVAAFVMFLAASALAIHESKPPPPPRPVPDAVPSQAPDAADRAPPSRAIHETVPPWIKYATPTPPSTMRVTPIEPAPTVALVDPVSGDYLIDVVDRCPDQPNDRDDNDGCPDPADRIILVE